MGLTDIIQRRRPSSLLSVSDWPPMATLQREMNRIFEDFWNNGGTRVARPPVLEGMATFYPTVDIVESNKHLDVTAEVPGMNDKEIKVNLSEDGETLTLEGEKKIEEKHKTEDFYFAERRYGHFRRVIPLPACVDAQHVEATVKDGVLNIHMAKLPESRQRVRQIPVKGA